MEFITRLADKPVNYPLPTDGSAHWQAVPHRKNTWTAQITLPPVHPEHIIVPSFSQLASPDSAYLFELHTNAAAYRLNPVPHNTAAHSEPGTHSEATDSDGNLDTAASAVSSHIDCWHTHAHLSAPRVHVYVRSPRCPEDYLLTLSIRPLELTVDTTAMADWPPAGVGVPRNISQMQAQADIRQRICSPTALSMALSALQPEVDWEACVTACYDPKTRAYGAWPLAIRTAAQNGHLAAVECFTNWIDVLTVLKAGSPLVCSIKFDEGQLDGAPLPRTGGHLVVLKGLDARYVWICDPAAADNQSVVRRLKLEQFSKAWLQHRGAAYIFVVPE